MGVMINDRLAGAVPDDVGGGRLAAHPGGAVLVVRVFNQPPPLHLRACNFSEPRLCLGSQLTEMTDLVEPRHDLAVPGGGLDGVHRHGTPS